jgi:hypothetical protein
LARELAAWEIASDEALMLFELDKSIIAIPETALLSKTVLAKDRNRPEENEAWSSPAKAP